MESINWVHGYTAQKRVQAAHWDRNIQFWIQTSQADGNKLTLWSMWGFFEQVWVRRVFKIEILIFWIISFK